jgi:hypothetical protein
MMTIDQLMKNAETHARAILIGGKDELTPIAHLVRTDGKDFVLATPWRDAHEKNLTFATLAALMRDDQVTRYMLLHEGWMRTAEPGEFTPEQEAQIASGDFMPRVDPIREHPKRIEVVIAIGVEKSGKTIRMWETKRNKRGVCVELVEIDTAAEQWKGPAFELMN